MRSRFVTKVGIAADLIYNFYIAVAQQSQTESAKHSTHAHTFSPSLFFKLLNKESCHGGMGDPESHSHIFILTHSHTHTHTHTQKYTYPPSYPNPTTHPEPHPTPHLFLNTHTLTLPLTPL